jgi:hypothetical protein
VDSFATTAQGDSVIVLRRPRRWVLAVAVVALAASGWLVLVPVTVVYVTGENTPAPQVITTRYSWWTTEQNFVYSDTGTGRQPHLVNGVRLNCSSLLGTGPHENIQAPAGPQACASVQTPRLIGALVLFIIGAAGLPGAAFVPGRSQRERNRYRQPYRQRRALRRGR